MFYRSNGVSVKGAKDELIFALESSMSSKTDGTLLHHVKLFH